MHPTGRPTFSVIVPNYNSGDKLARTLNSLREPGVSIEVIVMDGASGDRSLTDATEFAEAAGPWVRLVSERDAGIYDAMNRGIERAGGRYLYFIGSGDTLRPGALAQIARCLPADDRTLVYGNVDCAGRIYDGRFGVQKLRRRNLPHQAAFYGREIFETVGRYNTRYRLLADYALNLAIYSDRRIARKYVNVLVADYEGGGSSVAFTDDTFYRDKAALYRQLGRLSQVLAKVESILHRLKVMRFLRKPHVPLGTIDATRDKWQ